MKPAGLRSTWLGAVCWIALVVFAGEATAQQAPDAPPTSPPEKVYAVSGNPAATNFSVITNVQNGYIIDFRPRGDVFLSVLVTGLQSLVEIGAQGGSTLHNQPYGRSTVHQLGYRFILRPDVMPGAYPWPLEISVRAA